jgi:hypothetical protein
MIRAAAFDIYERELLVEKNGSPIAYWEAA